MRHTQHPKLPIVCSLIVVFAYPTAVSAVKVRRMTGGQWGGDHIQMSVEGNSATIEYDCAHGTIKGPLTIDSRGRFSLQGTHVREHGGPIRSDEQPNSQPAQYTGWTDGRKMRLTVKLKGTNEKIGTFNLVRGQEGRIFKCL
jgi:hypothetical protein